MIDKNSILRKITDSEERLAVARVLDMVTMCQKQHDKVYSDFLNPLNACKIYDLVRLEKDVNVYLFGGFDGAERKMIACAPDYLEIQDNEFPITAILVKYNSKYGRALTHRDFLGSVLGLGIDRSRVGDIVINNDTAQIFICSELSEYVKANLEKVGSQKVTVSEDEKILDSQENGEEIRFTIASLRLDVILSTVFRLPRSKSQSLIEGEKAFVNWSVVTSTSKQVAENDIITLRGFGRIKIYEICGKTKKDRIAIKIIKY